MGLHSTEVEYLLLTQLPWVRFLAFLRTELRVIVGTAWNSVQRLDIVNQTHLVQPIGKLVLQKNHNDSNVTKPVSN